MYIPLARCIEVLQKMYKCSVNLQYKSINAVLICWKFGCLRVIYRIIEFGLSKH